MRTIKITGRKLKLRDRKKYERKNTYERFISSVKEYNKIVDKLNGKTIRIRRVNQAIAVFSYAGCCGKDQPPMYWTANIDANFQNENEEGSLYLASNYRNVDEMEIL